MKKILLLSAALGMFPLAHADDVADSAGGHGFYVGGGFLFCNSGERVDYIETAGYNNTEANAFPTRIGGTLVLGYQRVLDSNPICLGLELGSDFSPRKEEVNNDKITGTGAIRYYNVKTTRNGFTPFAAVKVGYINYDHKFMAYLKAGVSYAESREIYDEFDNTTGDPVSGRSNKQIKLSSWMPIIALGVEKSLGKDITGRIEGEYRFAKTKKKEFNDPDPRYGGRVEFTQKGTLNIRALVCYNVKI